MNPGCATDPATEGGGQHAPGHRLRSAHASRGRLTGRGGFGRLRLPGRRIDRRRRRCPLGLESRA